MSLTTCFFCFPFFKPMHTMDNSNDHRHPQMCHSQGLVNYIGSFVEKNQLVYFAHDAVHYTGVQYNGCAGFDACFGHVIFVTHDFCLPNKDAYNEAFERARRKNALFCFIDGTEKHFVKPKTADETVANSLCELNLNSNTVLPEEAMAKLLNKINIA